MKKKIYILIGVMVFLIILMFLLLPKSEKALPISVITTAPKNNAIFVFEKSEVLIELNREITIEEGNNVKIKIEPEVKTEIVYLSNKIRISPETNFGYGVRYKIKVYSLEKEIYSFEFTTNPFTPEQLEKEGKLQAEGDLAYNEATKNFIEKNPWYTNLPIETNDYRIVYDYDKEMFRIRFLQEQTDEEKIKTIIEDALDKLERAGAKKPIKYYTVQPDTQF